MSLAIPLAGAALVPSEAEACSPDLCAYVDAWESLDPINAGAIPSDGVLILQGARRGNSPEEDWLAKVDLTVTRDGQPIAGAVETAGVRDVLLWRPAAPLEPGAYQVVGSLDNPEMEPYYEDCAPDLLTLDFEFMVEAEPSSPLAASPPTTNAQETLHVDESDDLEELVCCDGAMPYSYAFDCGGGGDYVGWGEGFCSGLQGFGRLTVQVSVESALPPSTSALVVRQLYVDGKPAQSGLAGALLSATLSQPFCTAVELRNLGTGETLMSEETCHGADVAAQLGDHALDPSEALAKNCAEGAYVCEVDADIGDRWDATKCTPWPGEAATTGDTDTGGEPTGGGLSGGEPGSGSDTEGSEGSDSAGQGELVDHGCACNSSAPSPLGALALLGLGLLRPRRRRRALG